MIEVISIPDPQFYKVRCPVFDYVYYGGMGFAIGFILYCWMV